VGSVDAEDPADRHDARLHELPERPVPASGCVSSPHHPASLSVAVEIVDVGLGDGLLEIRVHGGSP
jgi:hypothetical protein